MGAERSVYNLEIKTTADLSGLKAELAALEEATAQAKRMGIATGDADQQITKLHQTIASVEQAGKKGEEGFKIFGRGAHEAHAALDALNQALPGLGELRTFLANPVTAAIGLSVFVFSNFIDKVKEAKVAMQALLDAPDSRGEWAQKLADALEQATVAGKAWEHEMQRIIETHQTLKEKSDELVRSEQQQIQSANQVTQSRKLLNEAYVDFLVKLGQIPHEKAVKIKLQIDEAAFKEEIEQKLKGMLAELGARQKEQAENTAGQAGLRGNVATTAAAATAAEQAKIRNDSKLEQDKKLMEQSQERQRQAEKTIEELEGHGTFGGEYDPTDPQYYTLKAARDTQQAELNRQGLLRRSIKQEEGRRAGLDTNAATTKADADDAKSKYEESLKLANDLKAQIAKLDSDLEAEKAKVAALESAHHDANDPNYFANRAAQDAYAKTPGAQVGIDIDSARGALATARGHVQTGAGNAAELQNLLNEFVGLAKDIHATAAQKADLAQLQREVEQLRSRMNNGHGDAGTF